MTSTADGAPNNSRKVSAPGLKADTQLIGLVGLAHAISHFSQLVLAPLFPWLKDEFNVGFIELGGYYTSFMSGNTTQLGAAFSGLDVMQRVYAHAIKDGYRFYSYGDACLLFRS